jgi:hypothetical protein
MLGAHGIKLARGIAGAGRCGGEFHARVFGQDQHLASTGRAFGDQAMHLVREGREICRRGDGVGERAEAERAHGNGAP